MSQITTASVPALSQAEIERLTPWADDSFAHDAAHPLTELGCPACIERSARLTRRFGQRREERARAERIAAIRAQPSTDIRSDDLAPNVRDMRRRVAKARRRYAVETAILDGTFAPREIGPQPEPQPRPARRFRVVLIGKPRTTRWESKLVRRQLDAPAEDRTWFGYDDEELEQAILEDESELLDAGFSVVTEEAPEAVETSRSIRLPLDEEPRDFYIAPEAFVPDTDPMDDLPGYVAPDRLDPERIAAEADEEAAWFVADWLQRDVRLLDVTRWQLDPEANMSDEQKDRRAEARAAWRREQLRTRKAELHRLLVEWYGTDAYETRTTTVWREDASQAKGVRPEELTVPQWIAETIAAKGSELSGVASCAALMRSRIAKRKRIRGR